MPDPLPTGLSRRAILAGGQTIVSQLMAKALAHPELVSLAAGFVDQDTLPTEAVRQAFDALWANSEHARAALQYGTTAGYLPLRRDILNRLLLADGYPASEMDLEVEQVVITAGSNQFLHLVSDTLLDAGDIVLCGAPSYFVYMGILGNLGARAVGVEIDAEGLVPEALEATFARLDRSGELDRVKAIYVTSYYDNPSSVTTSKARRVALLEIARRWTRKTKIYLIEDAAYRELRYYGDDLPSFRSLDSRGDTVIHAGSFSKSFSPGIRVGWGILPPELVGPVLAQKGNSDFGSPHFNQVLMATVMELGLFDDHLARLCQSYRGKLDAMQAALEEHLRPIDGVSWLRPTGGLYVWLRLPENVDTGLGGPLFASALAEGVLFVPGQCCYPEGILCSLGNRLRLSFGHCSSEEIHRGIAALGRAVRGCGQ